MNGQAKSSHGFPGKQRIGHLRAISSPKLMTPHTDTMHVKNASIEEHAWGLQHLYFHMGQESPRKKAWRPVGCIAVVPLVPLVPRQHLEKHCGSYKFLASLLLSSLTVT